MKYQKQPNEWSCLPTCMAICLDLDVDSIIKQCPHDGSELIFPDLPEPLGRRGFHVQELLGIARKYGKYASEFYVKYGLQFTNGHQRLYNLEELDIKNEYGIIVGSTARQKLHAITFDARADVAHYYDPYHDLHALNYPLISPIAFYLFSK